MPTFSKFISSQRGAEQLLDSDGYIYSRKKSKDTALTSTWRCSKYNPPTKCKCHCYLSLSDHTLTLGTQPHRHNHSADGSAPARQEVLTSLKRKAADQPLSATQNLISERSRTASSTFVSLFRKTSIRSLKFSIFLIRYLLEPQGYLCFLLLFRFLRLRRCSMK